MSDPKATPAPHTQHDATATAGKEPSSPKVNDLKVEGREHKLDEAREIIKSLAKESEAEKAKQDTKDVKSTLEHAKEQVKEKAEDVKEKAIHLKDEAKEKAAHLKDEAKEKAAHLKDEAKEKLDQAKNKLEQVKDDAKSKLGSADDIKHKAENLKDDVKAKVSNFADQAKARFEQIKGDIEHKAEDLKHQSKNVADEAKVKIDEAKEKAKETAGESKQKFEHIKDEAKDKAGQYAEKAKVAAEDAKHKLEQLKDEAKTKIKAAEGNETLETIKHTAHSVEEAAKKVSQKAGELYHAVPGLDTAAHDLSKKAGDLVHSVPYVQETEDAFESATSYVTGMSQSFRQFIDLGPTYLTDFKRQYVFPINKDYRNLGHAGVTLAFFLASFKMRRGLLRSLKNTGVFALVSGVVLNPEPFNPFLMRSQPAPAPKTPSQSK